jgi:hypothetical protein
MSTSILHREFSDCAVGVLDKAFNEDNMRTFEMLDEKHPVDEHNQTHYRFSTKMILFSGLESYGNS